MWTHKKSWIRYALLALVLLLITQLARETSNSRRNVYSISCENKAFYLFSLIKGYENSTGRALSVVMQDESGSSVHSWRTAVFADTNREFANQYDFTKPWNWKNNLEIAISEGGLFSCVNNSSSSQITNYVAITDHKTGRTSLCSGGIYPEKKGDYIVIIEFPNSNIVWTEPRDVDISELKNLIPGNDTGGIAVLFSSGRTDRLSVDEIVKLSTRNDLISRE